MNILKKPLFSISKSAYDNILLTLELSILTGIMAFIFSTVLLPSIVPSSSMYPTLDIGEECLFLRTKEVDYGDIVAFYPDESEPTVYVKRLIGKEGDIISIHDGAVYRNGAALDEPYINEAPQYTMDAITVPAGSYFFMGDNRNDSYDSHCFGSISEDRVIGRALLHFNLIQPVSSAWQSIQFKLSSNWEEA